MSVPTFLARLPLFSTLNEVELSLLKDHLSTKRLAPGEILISQGERATRCYVLISGRVEVLTRLADGSDVGLAELGPGAMLGNLEIIDRKPSSATCRAGKQPAFFVVLEQGVFDKLFNAENPFAYKILDRIARDLTGKLRNATNKFAEISEKDMAKRAKSVREVALSAAKDLIDSRLAEVGLTEEELDEIDFQLPEV